jgi:hypothetical protein
MTPYSLHMHSCDIPYSNSVAHGERGPFRILLLMGFAKERMSEIHLSTLRSAYDNLPIQSVVLAGTLAPSWESTLVYRAGA